MRKRTHEAATSSPGSGPALASLLFFLGPFLADISHIQEPSSLTAMGITSTRGNPGRFHNFFLPATYLFSVINYLSATPGVSI